MAEAFELQYLSGGDVLKEMAKEQGFDSDGDDWWDTEEGMKFLNQREQNSEFDKKVDEKLTKLFNQGWNGNYQLHFTLVNQRWNQNLVRRLS